MKQLDLDLESREERAARKAKKAVKEGDEGSEYWTNSRNDWLRMARELEAEGDAEDDND
jgi:hypothetical protein